MKTTLVLLVFTLVTLVHGTIVTIPELGQVQGSTVQSAWTQRTIHQFLSMKYAKSPSGERRFAPPVAAEPWKEMYNATVNGIRCPQIKFLGELLKNPTTEDMEDCLSINVFTPKIPDAADNKLFPVMFFIHGGGLFEGEARHYLPNYLLEEDVLLVVPQYRLGPLGFLSLNTDGIAGNMGFMDQLMALRWVNKYIKHFGGDNTRVTVFGQSAGGASTSSLLLSPIVEPYLFQKAIVQSGAAYLNIGFDPNPLIYGKELYKVLTKDDEEPDVAHMEKIFKNSSLIGLLSAVAQQIKTDPSNINRIARGVAQKAGSIRYFTETPNQMLTKGNFRTVPMMAGVTKHDGSYFLMSLYDRLEALNLQNNDNFLRYNLTRFVLNYAEVYDITDTLVEMFNSVYFNDVYKKVKNLTFRDISAGLTDMYGVLILKAPTLKQAKINAQHANETFLYTFDYEGEQTKFGWDKDISKYPFKGGVQHCDELLYLFTHPTPLNNDDTKIAKIMTQLWTSFAIDDKPSSSLLNVEWPVLEKGKNGPYLHINKESKIGENFVETEFTIAVDESK